MNSNGISTWERINETLRMCEREQPIYEQISSFSIALYVYGYFSCADLLEADDVDNVEAGTVLEEYFEKIEKEDISSDYHITVSPERYLLVIGDPVFPTHFAVLADMKSPKPFFSKLPFFGSGFDSLAELKSEFIGKDGIYNDDIAYYRMKQAVKPTQKISKIYTSKADGSYNVFVY